jgi:hypothetical protein
MIIGRISTPLDLPIFNAPNYVARVSGTKHYFYLIAPVKLIVMEEQVQSPSLGQRLLRRDQFDLAQADDRRVVIYALLEPLLGKISASLEGNDLGSGK